MNDLTLADDKRMRMPKQHSDEQQHRQHYQSLRVAATLMDGPKTFEEILDSASSRGT
jgi:hypothetical protein